MSSAFVTYSRDFGKLNMEAGLRYENVDFKYYDDGKYMAEQSKTYGNWFPSSAFRCRLAMYRCS